MSDFSEKLVRMSRYRVGVKEAAALFAIGDGATASEVAERAKCDRAIMRIRLGMLRDKGLVKSTPRQAGFVVYKLSAAGKELVETVLKGDTK